MQHVGIVMFAAVYAENDQFPFSTLKWVVQRNGNP